MEYTMQDLPDYIVQALEAAHDEESTDYAIMQWLHRDNQKYRQPRSIRQIVINYKTLLEGKLIREKQEERAKGRDYQASKYIQRWTNIVSRITIALNDRTWE